MDVIICNEKVGGGESVRNFLSKIPDLRILHGLSTAEEIISATSETSFDLCVVGARSLDWWGSLRSDLAPVQSRLGKEVVMAHVLSAEYLVKASWLGMADVLYSALPFDEIVRRCVEVVAGRRDISLVSNVAHLGQFMPSDSVFRFVKDDLDVEILMLLVQGRTNEEIADQVHLALQTVRNRISRLIHDSGVQNRTQLALLVVR